MVLVTGATGLLGSHLVQALTRQGRQVKALYHNQQPAFTHPNLEWIQGDILDVSFLEKTMKGIDYVYHCAAVVSFHTEKKKLLHQINVDGTTNIVNTCLDAGVKKLVHVSSVAALGRMKGNRVITEKMEWEEDPGKSEYGKSKHLGEMEVWRAIAEGLDAAIVNPAIILGAGDWNTGSSEFFKTAYNEFPWYSEGINGFVDVDDVAHAMILLMDSNITNERFIICSENLSYKEVFTEIAVSFSKKPPYKKVTPFIAAMAWRLEALKALFTGKTPMITKETAHTAQATICYDNSKLLNRLPGFLYTPVKTSIKHICKKLKEEYGV